MPFKHMSILKWECYCTLFCIFIIQGLLENAVATLTKMDHTVKSIMRGGDT